MSESHFVGLEVDPSQFSVTHSATYSPLYLKYERECRKWSVDFQLRHEPTVIFQGDDPTTDEMLDVLASIPGCPVLLLQIMPCIVGLAKKGTP